MGRKRRDVPHSYTAPIDGLCRQIAKETKGMCVAGAGPYGFGMSNPQDSELQLILDVNPNPVDEENSSLFKNSKEYDISLTGVLQLQDGSYKKYDADTIKEYAPKGETEQLLKEVLLHLGTEKLHVRNYSCEAAFCRMAEEQIHRIHSKKEEDNSKEKQEMETVEEHEQQEGGMQMQ